MRKIIIITQFCILANIAFGQQYPYFSQHFLNPYVYNPAALGNSGYNELNLTYRQQWLGISDAPVTQAFNFQYPTSKNLSFGVNFYNDKTILLNTSALAFGLAYKVSFSNDQFVKFGLSSGVGFNSFDMDKADHQDDPAIKDVLDKTSFLTGQFGIYYVSKGLKIGFSLPQLYKYNTIDTASFQKVSITQLDDYIITASYRFNLGASKLGMEPFAMYRKSEQSPVVFETGAMLDYSDLFWIGGSYRKNYGGTGFVGINIQKNISFAYAYEFAGGQKVGLGNGSHEFNIKFRFGKNKQDNKLLSSRNKTLETIAYNPSKKKPKLNTAPAYSSVKPKPGNKSAKSKKVKQKKIDNEDMNVNNENLIESENSEGFVVESVQEEQASIFEGNLPDPNLNKPKPDFAPGFYVVLGAFEIYDNAISFSELLKKKGITVKYGYVLERGLYYVYTMKTQDFDQARQVQDQFTQLNDFRDAWVFDVK